MNADLALPSFVPGKLTPTAWVPPDDLSYDGYVDAIQKFATLESAVQWWIGDALNAMQKVYGETWAQVLPDPDSPNFEADKSRLKNYKWVAASVEKSTRVDFLPWTHHREVAALDPVAQRALLAAAAEKGLTQRELQTAVREYRRNTWLEEKGVDLVERDLADYPAHAYRVLLGDPPWAYDNLTPVIATTPIDYYPSMPTAEIAALPVSRLAAADSVLFLWSTSPHLPEALQVMAAWDFDYKTSFVWDKVEHNMGHYNSVRHELLLVGGRGSSTPDAKTLFDSVVVERRGEHSAKPGIFRTMIEVLYPFGRRIELFARGAVANWDVWGNEITVL